MRKKPAQTPNYEFRRCRPLLGTFVEIQVQIPLHGGTRVAAAAEASAVDAAFTRITGIQARLNYHDPASELRRFCHLSPREPTEISQDLHTLLRAAREYFRLSNGAIHPFRQGTAEDVICGENLRQAHCLRDVEIDFGGMAKGYAVDMACEVLRGHGLRSGLVNAGGDIRAFGERRRIHIRNPHSPTSALHVVELEEGALATSGAYFQSGKLWDRERRSLRPPLSVSVFAPTALQADAFTKWALLDRPSPETFKRWGAEYIAY
ncbi:MAG: FAD:protein FMN transferase [Bdellovibrionales bacterium]